MLAAAADYFEVPHEKAHQAKEDALTSGRILLKILEQFGIVKGIRISRTDDVREKYK